MKYHNLLASLLFILFFTETEKAMENQPEGFSPSVSLYITPNQNEVTAQIVRLLGLTGIRIKNDPLLSEKWPEARVWLNSRSLKEVVQATQGKIDSSVNWLGNLKNERWKQEKTVQGEEQVKNIINICMEELKQGEDVVPAKNPKAILFLGSTLSGARLRLAYLNKLIEEGKISPSIPVYVLTGERELDEKIGETKDELVNPQNGLISFRNDWKQAETTLPSDEREMMKLVFSQSRHIKTEENNIYYIYAPKGLQKRATTASTVEKWLEGSPEGGLYIAISNQPYVLYQGCVIRRVLLENKRQDINVQAIGSRLEESKPEDSQQLAQDLLSNVSRILYELLTIKNLN